jgi:pimeloyl-ACP methyl ester carboxylesterase
VAGPLDVRDVRGVPVEFRLDHAAHAHPAEAVVVLHGGHFSASTPFAEPAALASTGALLVPSRPGYGRTPVAAGPGPREFADRVAGLCQDLGITRVRAAVGISAGGPTAIALAERHPGLVRSLLLVSSRSGLPFPTGITAPVARTVFHPRRQAVPWAALRGLLRRAPDAAVLSMMASLSTVPPWRLAADLGPDDRSRLAAVFAAMGSGEGFALDLEHRPPADLGRGVRRPTLVVASRQDRQVPWRHAVELAARIPQARSWESPSLSHLVWFGSGAEATELRIRDFLLTAGR